MFQFIQGVRITPLVTENNTKEGKGQENQFIIDYLLLIIEDGTPQ